MDIKDKGGIGRGIALALADASAHGVVVAHVQRNPLCSATWTSVASRTPLTVDFHRADDARLNFGSGIQRCLGLYLARLDLRVVLEDGCRAFRSSASLMACRLARIPGASTRSRASH